MVALLVNISRKFYIYSYYSNKGFLQKENYNNANCSTEHSSSLNIVQNNIRMLPLNNSGSLVTK